jgi:excisionase family DNA binding protein
MEGTEEKLVISIAEAAKRLDISEESAYRAARRGELPTIRIGNLLKVPVARFLAMVNGGRP